MKKVMTVFGTRPEAIKMCPLILELKKRRELQTIVCLTGQHKEMLEQVMNVFDIKADYNLSIMKDRQTLNMITASVLMGVEEVLKKERPDIVLVHGDTTTSFAAALSSFNLNIPVAHVEAGLRTYNLKSPYPEEFNRQSIDIFSDIYFAPTETAKRNLLLEGKSEEEIVVTGNTVIDALKTTVKDDYKNEYLTWAEGSRLILMTAHRRENIGTAMEEMFQAVRQIVDENEDVKLIYPVHRNPAVREIVFRYLAGHDRIRLIDPLDVFDFHNFINKCYLVLTDSGGIQEEAPSLGKPVLVLRDTTERPEGVEAGTLKLVGTKGEDVYREISNLLNDKKAYMDMSRASNPYGDGHASERIVEHLIKYLNPMSIPITDK